MSLIRHIRRFPGIEWDWTTLSLHPSVNLKTLQTFEDKPWNWSLLTRNPNFVWMWVQTFPNKPWNWRYISESERFNWNWVREFPNKPWVWCILSDKIEGIETILEFPDKPWSWYTLTLGEHTSISDMLKNPNLPWVINDLLFTNVDDEIMSFLRFYRSHYDADAWCDHTVRTPWNLIKKNSDLPWVSVFIKIRDANEFDEDDVKYLYDEKYIWNWTHLSEMLDFNKIIVKNLDRPWDFTAVSRNKTVSYKDVLKFPELPWNHNLILLSDEFAEWNAANIIKKYWKRCVTDPAYRMCKKLLLGDLMNISVHGQVISENDSDS